MQTALEEKKTSLISRFFFKYVKKLSGNHLEILFCLFVYLSGLDPYLRYDVPYGIMRNRTGASEMG